MIHWIPLERMQVGGFPFSWMRRIAGMCLKNSCFHHFATVEFFLLMLILMLVYLMKQDNFITLKHAESINRVITGLRCGLLLIQRDV